MNYRVGIRLAAISYIFRPTSLIQLPLFATFMQISLLFGPRGIPADRAIYFACVNFFLFSFSSLMISRRQIISGSAGPIFAIFSPNESVLDADDRSRPLFPISQGMLPWQPCNFGKKCEMTFIQQPGILKRDALSSHGCAH